MPPFNFPSNPAINDIYTENGRIYKWDGVSWINQTGASGFTGSQGSIGFTGSQGSIGFTGSVGFTGSQGNQGLVDSNTSSIAGSGQILNIITCTQAQYDAATKVSTTLYIIVG